MKKLFFKPLCLSALICLFAAASSADVPAPWEGPAMKLDSTQRSAAQRINKIVDRSNDPAKVFGFNPKKFYGVGRMARAPRSQWAM